MIPSSALPSGRLNVSRPIAALLVLVVLAAIVVPAWVVTHPPRIVHRRHVVAVPQRVVPQAELPPVEPVRYQDLTPDDARDFNAQVPFVDGPVPPARPFIYAGSDDDRARATDCLAAAVLYEAGDDTTGEKAVAQVVLNRVRHPAFPKTVCGVVFQGSERSTGCQFTFSCDGAMTRWRPSDAAWDRARSVATMALKGAVDKPVGYATHYHTDWVVPYWQSSLDKIAAVGTHLFFRWTGWWGTGPAFNRHLQPGEPVIAEMAGLSDAHRTGAALDEAGAAIAQAQAAAGALSPLASDPNTFLLTIDVKTSPETFPAIATAACAFRGYCKVMMWTDKASTPAALPLDTSQVMAMAFSYLRDRENGFEKPLWNCQRFKRPDPVQCMRRQVMIDTPAASTPNALPMPTLAPPRALPTLDQPTLTGIRRKPGAVVPPALQPASTPTPHPVATPSPRPSPTRIPIAGPPA